MFSISVDVVVSTQTHILKTLWVDCIHLYALCCLTSFCVCTVCFPFCFPEDPTILAFKMGDLLILSQDRGRDEEHGWVHAQNERTHKSGDVALAAIYVIPTVTKPSSQILVRSK